MAGSFNASSAGFFIRSPRQASTIFGLDGASAPRSKGLFYVCFKQSGQVSAPATSGWQNNMGFLVKNIDRPSIQPEVTEVNQYNKKRQITLGYKIAPLKMTLYDTADSMVMQMWNEYSQWYFGDFGQSATSYSYDVTTANVNDSGSGFGYQPRPSSSSGSKDDPNDLNSQFFFSAIEVYQVFGGQYTRFDLINPKITAFDPDEMDYGSSEVALINISIAYEAVLYQNNGQPVAINQDSDAYSAFNGNFDGDAYSVGGASPRQSYGTSQPNTSLYPVQNFNFTSLSSASSSLINDAVNTVGGGSLSQFGNYDFGSLTTGVSLGGSTAADVAYLSSGNNALSSLLNLPVGSPAVTNPESNLLGASGNQPLAAISGAVYDSTIGALSGAGNPTGNPYASSYIQSNLVGAVAASAALSQNGPTNQLTTTGASGLTLNSQSYGIINAQMPAYSQLGYNAGVSDAYSPNSLPSSLPSDDSSFDDLDLSDLA